MTDVSDRVRFLLELAESGEVHVWVRVIAGDGQPSMVSRNVSEDVLALAQEWEAMRAALEDIVKLVDAHRIEGVTLYPESDVTRFARAALSAGVSPEEK